MEKNNPFFGWILQENPNFWEDNGYKKVDLSNFHYYGCNIVEQKRHPKKVRSERVDTHQPMRTIYTKVYLQAEKDIALTWEDIYDIIRIYEDVLDEIESCKNIYIEILKRFNKQKGK